MRRRYPVMQGEPGSGGGGGAGLPGGGGPGPGTPWYASLAPEGTQLPALVTEAPDFATFVKTAADLKAYQGQSLRIPGPDASDEAKAEFLTKLTEKVPGVYYMPDPENAEQRTALMRSLGAPEQAEGYEFRPPEGGTLDETLTPEFRKWALEANLTKEQAALIFERYNRYQNDAVTALREPQQQQLGQLKAEWGVTYPDRVRKIDHLLSRFTGTEGMRESLKREEAPPHVVKMFHEIAESVLGEGMQMVGAPAAGDGITPAEAADRCLEIRNNPAFFDEAHPDHKRLVAEHFRYMKLANPTSSHEPPARAGFG